MHKDPEEIADLNMSADDAVFEKSRSGIVTRRALLRAGAAGAATIAATPASATISALMCPPQAGVYGGGAAGNTSPAGSASAASAEDYSGAVPDDGPGMRQLHMVNHRTGETFNRTFVEGGSFVPEAIEEFSNFCRDWRRNEVKPYDPACPQIIWDIQRRLGMSGPFTLTSGYRSPATNAAVGGASSSYHLRGKATDITTPERSVAEMHAAARANQRGGLGKYTNSGFIHVDSGPVRGWGS